MNKTELINEVAEKTGFTKKDVTHVIDSVFDVIQESLGRGENVQLVGFGNFEIRERAARRGRNPQTGEVIEIAASRVPAFKAGKNLREGIR